MKIFISYSWADYEKVSGLIKDLPGYIDVWIDREGMSKGDELDPEVKQAIDNCHAFLVFLSTTSIAKQWIEKEVSWAFSRLDFDNKANLDAFSIVPVLLDNIQWPECTGNIRQLEKRLYIDATAVVEGDLENIQQQISDSLFRISAEWMGRYEPASARKAVLRKELKNKLFDYQEHLYRFVATLNCPLKTLVSRPAQQELTKNVTAYNEYTESFLPWLGDIENEVSQVYGQVAASSFMMLKGYIKNDVYQGVAYELNNIVESIHHFRALPSSDAEDYKKADLEREYIINSLQQKLEMLKSQINMFVTAINY